LQVIVLRDLVQLSQPSDFESVMTCFITLREWELPVGFTDTGNGTGMFNNTFTSKWMSSVAKQLYVQASGVCDGVPCPVSFSTDSHYDSVRLVGFHRIAAKPDRNVTAASITVKFSMTPLSPGKQD
jgi:hypothetical protein